METNRNHVLEKLEATDQCITQANETDPAKKSRCEVRERRTGKIIAIGYGTDDNTARTDAIEKAREKTGVEGQPVTREQRLEHRMSALERSAAATERSLQAILAKLEGGPTTAPATNPPKPAAATGPAGQTPADGVKFTDDELRKMLEESGVEIDGRWGRKRLIAEVTDRGLIGPKAAGSSSQPPADPPATTTAPSTPPD